MTRLLLLATTRPHVFVFALSGFVVALSAFVSALPVFAVALSAFVSALSTFCYSGHAADVVVVLALIGGACWAGVQGLGR